MGQAPMLPDGFGFPRRWRAAAVTALTGFQSAMVCNQVGMCWVGTMALETKASGNRTMRPRDWADSGPLEASPRQAQAQDVADE